MADLRVFALTHLLAAGFGFAAAPRELLETEVAHQGFFGPSDTKRVLSAAVESLRAENKLLVYSYKGFAAVSVERDGFLMFNGWQELIVPAAASYYADLSKLTPHNIAFDERTKIVTVRLSPLTMGDVAFEPEGARATNGGFLSFDQDEVEELSKLNYASARRAFVKQAQGRAIVDAAKREAKADIQNALELPLRIAGSPDIKVVASFSPRE